MPWCGCVEHGLEYITFFMLKNNTTHLAVCSGSPLVRDGPLGASAFVRFAYCPHMNATGPLWWWVNKGSGNNLVPSDTEGINPNPLPEPMLTNFLVTTWRHHGPVSEQVTSPLLFVCMLCDAFSLTHWGRDKIATIFQTTFSNGFSSVKMYKLRLRFHWNLFRRVRSTIFQHWFK